MKKWVSCVMVMTFAVTMCVGCAGSSEQVETTAEHDELAQWVDENPEPEEVDPDAQ
ncbi:hypothetical protein Mal15_66660 [Stieleria maiorica]|uniref:Secreted protein n=1 Tax=Stieleria maiorica TaxID=2795974 RepID=A0A5B9MRM2_9BACT|nr:hypothetical protein [Stieleria maiorica]QEG02545.1 hypothetical protein Mal15_66660 [Stieleria maiorica]